MRVKSTYILLRNWVWRGRLSPQRMTMNEHHQNLRIVADNATGIVTVEVATDYGPIVFSYSPEAVGSGIAALVADILKRDDRGEPQNKEIDRFEIPTELVKQAAQVYDERARQTFPDDAIERYGPSSQAYARGVIEQFSDNLVPTLILMLNYLAAITLIQGGSDSKRLTPEASNDRQAIVDLLQDRLRRGIHRIVSG
jgi:hypothetical protein